MPHRVKHDREQMEYLARTYGLQEWKFHLADGERITSRTVNAVNVAKAAEEWNSSNPRIIVIDNLLG